MSSAKWLLSRLGLNELRDTSWNFLIIVKVDDSKHHDTVDALFIERQ